jgi:transcriptional regulator with XRE-family HTH domain
MRKIRESAGIKQKTIAYSMGFTPPYISGLEKGNRRWSDSLIAAYNRAVLTNK